MDNIFESKNVKPMLIGRDEEAFDSPDYIYELKLDGERCIAFLDKETAELRNKRNIRMLPKVPELSDIYKYVKKNCILDGELIILKNGVPDFSEIQARSLMSNKFKIELASQRSPATFVAYDILYLNDKLVTDLPLMKIKLLLRSVVKEENSRFAVSRYIEEKGKALYELAKQNDLEGVVAKKKDSRYYFDKRTKDWVKIKYLKEEDLVVCGYIYKENNIVSLVLGQYHDNELIYMGHVTMGISKDDFSIITSQREIDKAPFREYPHNRSGNDRAIWIAPELVCTVKYMEKTSSGGFRQPVFKGLRLDKSKEECLV